MTKKDKTTEEHLKYIRKAIGKRLFLARTEILGETREVTVQGLNVGQQQWSLYENGTNSIRFELICLYAKNKGIPVPFFCPEFDENGICKASNENDPFACDEMLVSVKELKQKNGLFDFVKKLISKNTT